MKPGGLLILSAALCVAAPAWAQNGAVWTDAPGTSVTLGFGGAAPAITPSSRDVGEAAKLFKSVCADSGLDRGAIAAAALAADWDLKDTSMSLSGGKDKPGIHIGLWTADGLVIATTSGFFAVKPPQCGVAFYPANMPTREQVDAALVAVMGRAPDNGAEAVKPNGKPNKRYTAAWTIAGPAGVNRLAYAGIQRAVQFTPANVVLFSVVDLPIR